MISDQQYHPSAYWVGLRLGLAASGYKGSLLEQLRAASLTERLGLVSTILPLRTRTRGLSSSRLPHKLDCSLRLLSGELEAPIYYKEIEINIKHVVYQTTCSTKEKSNKLWAGHSNLEFKGFMSHFSSN